MMCTTFFEKQLREDTVGMLHIATGFLHHIMTSLPLPNGVTLNIVWMEPWDESQYSYAERSLESVYCYRWKGCDWANITLECAWLPPTSGGVSVWRSRFTSIRIPHIKDKTVARPSYRQHGNPIPGKDGLYIETGASLWYHCGWSCPNVNKQQTIINRHAGTTINTVSNQSTSINSRLRLLN